MRNDKCGKDIKNLPTELGTLYCECRRGSRTTSLMLPSSRLGS